MIIVFLLVPDRRTSITYSHACFQNAVTKININVKYQLKQTICTNIHVPITNTTKCLIFHLSNIYDFFFLSRLKKQVHSINIHMIPLFLNNTSDYCIYNGYFWTFELVPIFDWIMKRKLLYFSHSFKNTFNLKSAYIIVKGCFHLKYIHGHIDRSTDALFPMCIYF